MKILLINKLLYTVQVLSDAKDEVDSIIFQETQFMEVEPILVERYL